MRGPEPFVRYVDVALLAAVLQDDLLATSLRKLYLEPLEAERDGEGGGDVPSLLRGGTERLLGRGGVGGESAGSEQPPAID